MINIMGLLRMEDFMKKYIWQQKYSLLFSALLTLICSFFSVFLIYAVQNLVDSMITRNIHILRKMIILLSGMLAANYILGYFSILVEAKISQKLHLSLKKDLFQSILTQRFKEYKETSVGAKLSVFENDINLVEEYYLNNIFVMIRDVIILVVAVTYLFSLDVLMGLLLLVCSIIIFIIPLMLGKNIDPISEDYSNEKAKFIGQLKDYYEGMDVVHAYNIEQYVQDSYSVSLEKLENKLFQLKNKLGLYNQTMITGNYLIIAISFSVGGYLVVKSVISVGKLIAITQVMNIIMQPMGEMTSALIEIIGSFAVRQKLEHMIEKKEQEIHQETDFSKQVFSGIECRNVSYLMEEESFDLKEITLRLEPQKKYVVMGPSGCGKTTLLKIIAGVLDPSKGSIYMNGLNYAEHEGLVTKTISLIHQDTFIFNDTMENNILLYQNYKPEIFDNVISVAGLEGKLKKRIQEECSEGGSNLSGGEKQRIAIARALLRNSPVLLLDEVTSALDRITAKKIVENLFEMKDKMIVFVTHKMEKEFLEKADCIICMNEGMIIESGSWDELISEKGYFYKLYVSE